MPHLMVLRGFLDSATAGLLCILWGLLFTVTGLSLDVVELAKNISEVKLFLLMIGICSILHGLLGGFRIAQIREAFQR